MGRPKGSKNKSKTEVLTKRTAIAKPAPPIGYAELLLKFEKYLDKCEEERQRA